VWVFDQVIAEAVRDGAILCSVPLRLTALLALESDWSIASAYWSVPFPTQAEQDTTKLEGGLEPGKVTMQSSPWWRPSPKDAAVRGIESLPQARVRRSGSDCALESECYLFAYWA
jgi:hypothetical protein